MTTQETARELERRLRREQAHQANRILRTTIGDPHDGHFFMAEVTYRHDHSYIIISYDDRVERPWEVSELISNADAQSARPNRDLDDLDKYGEGQGAIAIYGTYKTMGQALRSALAGTWSQGRRTKSFYV